MHIVFLLILLTIVAPLQSKENITIFRGSIEGLAGPKNEVEEIKNFPFHIYQISHVNELGFFYLDDIPDGIKNKLRWGYTWEDYIVERMKQYAVPGTVAIDIGSHIGTHLISLSKMVGKGGRVLGFEPQKKLFSELVWNMVLNQCHNVIAYRCALGERKDQIQMCPADLINEGGTPIGSGGDFAPMIPLDSLHLTNVSFIKLDVESSEDEVLRGARKTILKNKPVIIIEIQGNRNVPLSDQDRNQKIGNTHKLLNSMGYQVIHIWGDDWLALPL